ncbi:MAG: hypothetical protein UFJ18_00590 [Blautia sp.]|nr:hypothetical protein [Blautia sp.]
MPKKQRNPFEILHRRRKKQALCLKCREIPLKFSIGEGKARVMPKTQRNPFGILHRRIKKQELCLKNREIPLKFSIGEGKSKHYA